jgi:HEAT repeat protein
MSDLSALVRSLASGSADERADAAQRLAQMEAEAQPAAVPLVEACAADDDAARPWVTAALESLGPPRPSDLPQLVALLPHVSPDVGYWAATLLGRLKSDAAPAVAALAKALSGSAPRVRQRAAWALGQIGPAAGAARSELETAAAEPDPRLAALAREALAALGA